MARRDPVKFRVTPDVLPEILQELENLGVRWSAGQRPTKFTVPEDAEGLILTSKILTYTTRYDDFEAEEL